jgi:thermitase
VQATASHALGPEQAEVLTLPRGEAVDTALRRYRRDRRIAIAEPNRRYTTQATPNDPLFSSLWGLSNTGQSGGLTDADIDAPEAYDRLGLGTAGGAWPSQDFAVGVIDTGVDDAHEDLAGKIIQPCRSALTGSATFTPGCLDDNGHGTHVTGTIAAVGNNGKGIVGVAPGARVFSCKALDSAGSGFDADIAACINDIVAKRDTYNIRVISMSLGGTDTSSVLSRAVEYAFSHGVLVVAAAGNDGNTAVEYPAGYPDAVSVGATDRHDAHASFSNSNADVEVSAPGVSILSTVPTYPTADMNDPTGYLRASGTSMATPHAAAVAALISARTGKTGQALRDALDASVDDLGPAGRDPEFGFGRINACLALGGRCSYRGVAPSSAATGTATTSPAPVGSSPVPAVTRTYRPTEFHVLTGGSFGSVRRLYVNDSSRLELTARHQGSSYVSDFYAATIVPGTFRAGVRALGIAYDGNVSRSSGLRLLIYDWSAHRWSTIYLARRAGTRDKSVHWTSTRLPARFLSSGGAIRLRIRGTGGRTLRTRTDLVRFSVTGR